MKSRASMLTNMSYRTRLLATASGIVMMALPAAAQQTAALEEIVVTAQRREQNIQDVPIAVSAFTDQALETKGVNDVSQLGNFTPNVTLDNNVPFGGSTSVLAAYIRGIGQNDFAFNFDPGVGVYVDGVYMARTVGANVDLLDVDRIEVLKGPQGTLFGRNTIGGAINIITRDPGDEFYFDGEITTGRFERFDVRGSADIPISDTLSSSIAFSTKNRNGYQKRIRYPAEAPFNVDAFHQFHAAGYETSEREGGQNEWNLRGKILWDPNNDWRVELSGDYTNVDQPATANTILKTHPSFDNPAAAFGPFYNTCINTPASVIATLPFGGICGERGVDADILPEGVMPWQTRSPLAGVNVDDNPDNDRLPYDDRFVLDDPDLSYATGNSFSRIRSKGVAANITWDFADAASLRSISSYRELDWQVGMDLDGSPLSMLHTSFDMGQEQYSQEFQLSGLALDNKLDYVLGLYYFHEEGHLIDHVTFPAGLLQVYGPNDLWTTSWAGFAHLNYSFTDQFSITVGARYTDEDKKFEGFQHDLNASSYKFAGLPVTQASAAALGFPDPSDLTRYFPPGIRKQNFTDFSPRLGVEFRPTDTVMLYASYSEGFKSGSWTTRLSNPVTEAESDILTFGPEEATTYEAGVKSEFLNRRIQWNSAVFYTDYKDIQLNFQLGVSPTFQNAGDAEIYGFESELQAAITESFRVNANVGYVHAEYTSLAEGVTITLDHELPKTPEWKFNISPQYEVFLGNDSSLLFNVDYTHTSSLYNDTENTELLKRPSTDILNASVTYRAPSGHWDLQVGGSNLLDERYLVTGQAQVAGGVTYGTYSRPPEWFATLRLRY